MVTGTFSLILGMFLLAFPVLGDSEKFEVPKRQSLVNKIHKEEGCLFTWRPCHALRKGYCLPKLCCGPENDCQSAQGTPLDVEPVFRTINPLNVCSTSCPLLLADPDPDWIITLPPEFVEELPAFNTKAPP